MSLVRKLLIPILIILSLLSLWLSYHASSPKTVTNSRQCQLDDELNCVFNLDDSQQVIVKFAANVQVEEQNQVNIVVPQGYNLVRAWVQGVNMYMGQTALMVEKVSPAAQGNAYLLSFFLGSCSEAHMRWQLVIELQNDAGEDVDRLFVNFATILE